jgi:hypothetical protein
MTLQRGLRVLDMLRLVCDTTAVRQHFEYMR